MMSNTKIEEDGTIKSFTDWIKADGSSEFKPESGRYHLYVQHLCPYAHRAILGRSLKGLQKAITLNNLDWDLSNKEKGWKFSAEKEGCDADSVGNALYLREIYEASAHKLGAKGYSGTVTVPVLFDKKTMRIVNNESSEILRMFNSEFNELCETEEQKKLDLYPSELRDQIEEVEGWTQKGIIFGCLKPVKAQTQADYDAGIINLYEALDKLEKLLATQRYLLGSQLTEADVRLFVALIRFDTTIIQHFCAKKRIADYPAIWGYLRDLYQNENIRPTVHIDQIIKGFSLNYKFKDINPFRLIPVAPDLDYDAPHNRENL